MIQKVTKLLMNKLPIKTQRDLAIIKHYLFRGYAFRSYSQEGEDMILRDYFRNRKGFFVDIGANHPYLFSNTQLLYEAGWRGINIDAYPGSMKLFKKTRPRDINLEIGISNSEKPLTFLAFNDPLVSGFESEITTSRHNQGRLKIQKKKVIKAVKLSKVLERHAKNKKIDLMNLDVEGHELEVLKSNDWKKFSPEVIIVEVYSNSVFECMKTDVYKYLTKKNYYLYAKTNLNLIFKHS